ncbi:GM10989 [Drosophila sechellia]|uniref:GM10989 n=1 Tax=Drosophila sechellia TaxID=7238 RepID=B4I4Z8_DROSE|nr:GM10989 [Drosophila sechellia]
MVSTSLLGELLLMLLLRPICRCCCSAGLYWTLLDNDWTATGRACAFYIQIKNTEISLISRCRFTFIPPRSRRSGLGADVDADRRRRRPLIFGERGDGGGDGGGVQVSRSRKLRSLATGSEQQVVDVCSRSDSRSDRVGRQDARARARSASGPLESNSWYPPVGVSPAFAPTPKCGANCRQSKYRSGTFAASWQRR